MFLVCVYKFFNSINVNEKILNFALECPQSLGLYDFMETNEDIALLVFKIKKITKKECKDPLVWCRAHEMHYSMLSL
jgi:hypothetical protein